jgi:hypothetical protein
MITMLLLNIAIDYYFIFLIIHVYSQLEWNLMDFAIIQSIKQYFDHQAFLLQL